MSEDRMEDASAARRPRAPTITIDTSAAPQEASAPPAIDEGSQSTSDHHNELRPAPSFDSTNTRPTSPHNISSPTTGAGTQSFLSVPNARSRGNSVDSDEVVSAGSFGGDTFIPSPASSQNGRATTTVQQDELLSDEEALKPDPGNEPDFEVQNNPFAFSPGQLNKLLNPTSLGAFHALGGLGGLEKGLRTDHQTGISIDEYHLDGNVTFEQAVASGKQEVNKEAKDIEQDVVDHDIDPKEESNAYIDRKRVFSDNRLPDKKAKSIWELAWLAYNDKVLILLTVAAVVSLALGIYQSVSPNPNEEGAHVEWVEGVAIMVAIVIVVVVGAANDWQKERQFVKLNRKKDDRFVKVVRSGKSKEMSVHDVLVGDVLHLEPGDLIPSDGIFISGHNVVCDESSATGESDLKRKTPGHDAFRAIEKGEPLKKVDPFIISGGKVNEGVGTYLVTSTGVNSSWGKTMMSLREDPQTTPLQGKLNKLAEYIAKLGLAAGLLLFFVTFIEFAARLDEHPPTLPPDVPYGPREKAQGFLQVFIVAVTVVVVAVPEGLPLAVTLALAFATTRMLKDNNLVRLLRACETMGNATTICSDKTGTLTQNKMTVVAGTIGSRCKFGEKGDKVEQSGESPSIESTESEKTALTKNVEDEAPTKVGSIAEITQDMSAKAKTLLKQSIVLNSTAFEGNPDSGDLFIGSKTETALLLFAKDHLGMGSLAEERSGMDVVQLIPFDSGRKCMATAIKTPGGKYRLFVKGASEIMLSKCTSILRDPIQDTESIPLTERVQQSLNDTINNYASRSLRTIGILYKEFEQWPPRGYPVMKDDNKLIDFDKAFKDMTFLGVVGIQDPLRDGVETAVKACQKAGVVVRMVTGDNIVTAKAIATECGIYTAGGIVMEGPQFRKLSKLQMSQMIPRLQVLARSSPDDKRILVKRLREMGETVAVTGDGTNDAPALKTADVGFSMGISGTEVAKEASAIILMDDNFASIVKAMMWGRAVNDAVQKFLQFQITVNITAVFLTFISAVVSREERSVLTAVQLLWVNLIMDTFAALALATDPPPPSILDRKPQPKSAPLITLNMWKMIVGQSIFQLVVTFILYYAGPSFLKYGPSEEAPMRTLVFNTFVWMQIFNQWNSRRLDNKLNIFEGMHRNPFFIGIQFIICGGQILIIFVGGAAFAVTRIDGAAWGISVILGLLSIPMGMLIRCIPDDFIRKCIPEWLKRKAAPSVVVEDEEHAQYEWNPAFDDIKEELTFLKMIRGGRINRFKYKLQHPREFIPRSRSGSRASSVPRTPNNEAESAVATEQLTPESRSGRRKPRSRSNSAFGPIAAAGIVAGSIGGWSPIERHEGDGFGRLPISDKSDLEGVKGLEVHPETRPDDPVLANPAELEGKPPSQNPETTPAPAGDKKIEKGKQEEAGGGKTIKEKE